MTALWIILFILALLFMILIHEGGHFFAAKAVGIRAEQFSIGFGPEIVGWDRGGTRYSIKWILAGGSVRILGMDPGEEISEEDRPYSYKSAPYWKRAVVILAGSFAQVLFALIILYLLFWPIGVPELSPTSRAGNVEPTIEIVNAKKVVVKAPGPASQAGIKKGDVITEVDGIRVHTWDEMTKQIRKRPGESVTLTARRGSKVLQFNARLLSVDNVGILGVQRSTYIKRSNPIGAVWESLRMMGVLTAGMAKAFVSLFSVRNLKVLFGTAPRTVDSPRSIFGAGQVAVQQARLAFAYFLMIIAYFYIFLAAFNLIPLPPFDGGHLLVIVYEKVFKREIDMRKLAPIAWIVLIILIFVAGRLFILDIFNPLPPP